MNPMSVLNNPILSGQQLQADGSQIRQLRKSLNDMASWVMKGSVGTQQQGLAFASAAGSELAPLVPQSIDPVLQSATVTNDELVFWPMLQGLGQVDSLGLIHETNVITDVSYELDPFFASGGSGTKIEESFARRIVEIKLLSRREVIDDVSATVGITGFNGMVDRGMLAVKTQTGTTSLLNGVELQLFQADASLNPLHFDGLYKQLITQNDGAAWFTAGLRRFVASTGQNYYDHAGGSLTPQMLIQRLHQLSPPPALGYPDCILMAPEHHSQLQIEALAFGRDNGMNARGRNVFFGVDGKLYVAGPRGPVECVMVPHLARPQLPPSAAVGEILPLATFAAAATVTAAAGSANSQFAVADAGDYIYRIVAVGDKGQTTTVTLNGGAAVTVAATQKVTIDVQEIASGASQGATSDTATTGSIRYFRVYRSSKNGAVGTCKYLFSFPVNTSGAGANGTLCVDENYNRPGCAPVYMINKKRAHMYWANLLGLTRRPLHAVNTTIPFLLMMFGSMHVRIPSKQGLIDNVSLA